METKWVNYKIEDGILYATYKANLLIDLEKAKLMVAERLAYQGDKLYPIIIKFNGSKADSKPARAFMAKEGIQGISLGAFIVDSFVEKVILNFFLTVEKPPVPAKGFTKEDDAIKWINEIRFKK